MNLLEIRTQFAKLSGRYDLVNADYTDNGADYFLKAGIKLLDRLTEHQKDSAKFFKTMAVGDYFVEFTAWRVTNEVWFATADGRYELEYLTPVEFQLKYGSNPYADVDPGTPAHFTYAITRSVPEGTALDIIGNYGSEIQTDGSQVGKQGLLISPPTDTAGQIEVWGKYFTPWPASDSGTNFWMDSWDHIAINAGLYQLEVSYRNTEGSRDWLNTIKLELMEIDKDIVENDSDRAGEMNG